ncbi:hypothetical protein ACJMK2_035076 [Sinanodonta woodiana]|uniref:SOCS box domain-containing protein n=1 Tax=Sinanodonta woodiana TaxID=1069815 RepID=A0ABD3WTR6_SINWO
MEVIDPNASKESAMHALTWCVNMGHLDVLQALLRTHFAECKLSDMGDKCADVLMHAARDGTSDAMSQLLMYVDDTFLCKTKERDNNYVTKMLCLAVEKGEREKVNILVTKRADVNAVYHGKPLLHLSLALGHVEIAKVLVESGASVNAADKRGECAISSAICSSVQDKKEVVRWLIENGMDINRTAVSGKKPIHVAAAHSADVVRELALAGCDVNQPDDVNSDTPLHIACARCCSDTVIQLIRYGAKFNVLNNQGETVLEKLLKFAQDHHNSLTKARVDLAKRLISIGFKVFSHNEKIPSKTKRGRNKLHDLYLQILKSTNQTRSLQSICRSYIRDRLQGVMVSKQIETFDIPQYLKEYLLFQDEDI